jgi:dethiobiotin synthetase
VNYFVTAIGTDSGKTLASAILCQALEADYWKPIQAGLPRDADTVKSLIVNPITQIHPETYFLKTPASPHASAKADGITIEQQKITLPKTKNKNLIIEGAGGCLVPLNDTEFIIDLIRFFNAEAIVVSDLYLGSINHTLLTIEALLKREITIKGIIFNGKENKESMNIILKHTGLMKLLHINREPSIDFDVVKKYATQLISNWHE